tara:strand:- start:9087 stop:9221 length:135 start_codon:yes stop_codon:yes gene_type:complete
MKRKRKDQKIEKIAFTLSSGPNKIFITFLSQDKRGFEKSKSFKS